MAINYLGQAGTQVLVDKIKAVSTSSANIEEELKKKVPLGDDGVISSQYLPSYVDDVVEITSILADEKALPTDNRDASMLYYIKATKQLNQFVVASKSWTKTTPEVGKIYVTKDTDLTYRWSGSDLVEISKSIALGETSSTAYSGDKGAANRKDIDAIKSGDLPLVSPSIVPVSGATSLWTVKKAGEKGAVVAGLVGTGNLTVLKGYTVVFNGSMKWTHDDSHKDPTAMSGGNWSNKALPASGVLSDAYTTTVTSDTTVTAGVQAAKQGLVESNGIIKWASDSDVSKTTASVRVHFNYKVLWQSTAAFDASALLDAVTTPTSGDKKYITADGRNRVLTGITTTSDQYFVYAYPASLGDLTKITLNDATPLLNDGFVKSTLTVTDPDTGASDKYNVYTSVQKGAFTNAKLDIA